MVEFDDLFERAHEFPDPDADDRFARLVGIGEHKAALETTISLLVAPKQFDAWSEWAGLLGTPLIEAVRSRPPLVVLAGDVGSGKTELAETIGAPVSRRTETDIILLPLSLSTRGQGRVGEMTQLVSAAFDQTLRMGEERIIGDGRVSGGVILLVDEADALAQSRENGQMHHEDKAGVNAFIRGIDRLKNSNAPVAVIMCTNRLGSLDPAIRRRAANILEFGRPSLEQRQAVFAVYLSDAGLDDHALQRIAEATGPQGEGVYGMTFSDITQRLLPEAAFAAYRSNSKVTETIILETAARTAPTPPFNEPVR